MRRWALRLFVFLLLGAIVNVAVAWGCATWWPNQATVDYVHGATLYEFGGRTLHATTIRLDRAGLPLRSIGWKAQTDLGNSQELLPMRPIWPGFAINTVFYAAVLWVLFAAPFALRKWRRIKRGRCPKCGYDLRGSETRTCPECGAIR
jgi:hypothetical protein